MNAWTAFALRTLAIVGTAFFVAAALLFAREIARGSVLHDAAIVVVLLAPAGIWLALVRPLTFPYGLYVALLPFDMFLSVSRAGTLTKLLGIASGLVLIYFCLRTKRLEVPRLPLYLLGFFVAWTGLTLLWAVEPQAAAEPLQTLFGLMLLYAALSLAPIAPFDFKTILIAIVAGYLAVAVYGIVSFNTLFATAMQQPDVSSRLILSAGTHYIDPNEYGDSLIFPLAATMMLGFRASYISAKLLWYAVAAVMVAAIALSGSREAVVALFAVLVYYFWRSRHRAQLALLTILMTLAAAPMITTLSDRFQKALVTGGAGRTSIWAVGLAAAKHYGLLGAGIGSFPIVYDRFYLSVPQTYLYGWNAPPHNVLLRYLVELGVVGVALIALFVAAHFVILRSIERDHPLYDYRVMLEAGLIGICVSAFFIDSFHGKWTWLVFATAVQLVNLASGQKRRACNPSPSPSSTTQRGRAAPPLRVPAFPILPSR